ncbi:hypothetical protein D3C75_1204020 [compost metagenome]
MYRAVDIGRGGGGHLAEVLAVGRVAQGQAGAIAGVDPVGANQHAWGAANEGFDVGVQGGSGGHGKPHCCE